MIGAFEIYTFNRIPVSITCIKEKIYGLLMSTADESSDEAVSCKQNFFLFFFFVLKST